MSVVWYPDPIPSGTGEVPLRRAARNALAHALAHASRPGLVARRSDVLTETALALLRVADLHDENERGLLDARGTDEVRTAVRAVLVGTARLHLTFTAPAPGATTEPDAVTVDAAITALRRWPPQEVPTAINHLVRSERAGDVTVTFATETDLVHQAVTSWAHADDMHADAETVRRWTSAMTESTEVGVDERALVTHFSHATWLFSTWPRPRRG